MPRKPAVMIRFDDIVKLLRGENIELWNATLMPDNEVLDASEQINKKIVQLVTDHRNPGIGGRRMNEKNKMAVSFEELAYSNMLTLNALVELLTEKGFLTQEEVLQRMKKLQEETAIKRKEN